MPGTTNQLIGFRLPKQMRADFERAVANSGVSANEWLLDAVNTKLNGSRLVQGSASVGGAAGRPPEPPVKTDGASKTAGDAENGGAPRAHRAAEIAAKIPGVVVGIPTPDHAVTVVSERDVYGTPADGAPPFDPTPTEPDEEEIALAEFGGPLIGRAGRELKWWAKADWKTRLERLREMRDSAVGA